MSGSPRVSVVIPTRNRWRMLAAHGLASAQAQEDVEIEIVVVDDASDDETPSRLREAAATDDRLRTLRHDVRGGLAAARNTGAAAARAEWLAFLDDDDLWAPQKLRLQLAAVEEAGADWVYGRTVVVDAAKHVIGGHPFPDPASLAELLRGGNHVPGGGSNVLVRAAAFRAAGGFDETLRYFEDWDLWLRLLQLGPPARLDAVVVARVEHGRNMLFRDRADVASDFERLLSKHEPVTQAQRLAIAEWLAHEHVRAGYSRRAALLYLRAGLRYRSPGNLVAAAGALAGRPGLAAASRLLVAATGRTHLSEALEPTPARAPDWLSRYV